MNRKVVKKPEYHSASFVCPFCNVLAEQNWGKRNGAYYGQEYVNDHFLIEGEIELSKCKNCEEFSIWKSKEMTYPREILVDLAHDDMPEDVKELYNEAREVSCASSRAAAALLRVALEKLTEHLGESEGALNSRIGKLKEKGLPDDVIKSLDIVRINANEGGSHAGEIDLDGHDNKEIVSTLFWLVNYIVEKTITERKVIKNQFDILPKNKKTGIINRDKK